MSSFNHDLIRNDTSLDVINAYNVSMETPPPHIIVSSPCCGVIAVATPVGITFYWTDCIGNNSKNSVHSVPLPERISSMVFFPVVNSNMARLYIATVERVFIWEISTIFKDASKEKRDDSDLGPRTTILEQHIQKDAMAISASAKCFAVSLGKDAVIYDLDSHFPKCRFEGHYGTINTMTFFTPHAEHVLITVGEDRTFKLWDCEEQALLYQSSVISSSPFLTVAVDPVFPHIALGTVDGGLRIYRCRYNQRVDSNDYDSDQHLENMNSKSVGAFFCSEIHYDNIGRLLDRRDHLRHGNTSIYDDENFRDSKSSDNTVSRTQENYDNANLVDGNNGVSTPIVSVVSALPQWAQVRNTNNPNQRYRMDGQISPTNNNNNIIKPSRSIVFLNYRAMPSQTDGGLTQSDEEDYVFDIDSREKKRVPNILNSTASYLIIGTAKALLHLNTNTYMIDSVLEFDYPNTLPKNKANEKQHNTGIRKASSYGALSPLAAKATQIATSRHPAIGLPGIQLSTGCIFCQVEKKAGKSAVSLNLDSENSLKSSSLYMFIGNTFKGDCNIIQLPSNEDIIRTNCMTKKKQAGRRRVSRYAKGAEDDTSGRAKSTSLGASNEVNDHPLEHNEGCISIFPTTAAITTLHKSSPLTFGYKQTVKTSSHYNGNNSKGGGKRTTSRSSQCKKLKNKPVTFHTRIRSSGYGKAPKYSKLFTSNSNRKKKKSSESINLTGESSMYPTHEELIYSKGTVRLHQLSNTPLNDMKFTSDARSLSIGFADGTATSTRLPFAKDKTPARYIGHEGPITSIDWNHNRQLKLLLTSSEDGSVKIWKRNRPAAILNINNDNRDQNSNSSSRRTINTKKSSTVTNANSTASSTISSSVKVAKFFYMDKFVILATSNRLEMYKYVVDHLTDEKNDLRRLQNHSKCKLVKTWNEPSQTINSIALQNNFFSHVVITSGTNRSIHIYDMNKGQLIKTMEQAHGRSVHSVVLPTLSDYTSLPTNIYDIFLSGATDGVVKLWDLRASCKCVRTFQEHTNRVQKIGIAFSPCMRYVACGSENKCTYVYDLRNGQVFDKIRGGHNDNVSCCAFNPKYPQLVTGGADGKCVLYNL